MTHEQLRAIALEVAKETNLDIPESFIVDFALRFLAAVAEKAELEPAPLSAGHFKDALFEELDERTEPAPQEPTNCDTSHKREGSVPVCAAQLPDDVAKMVERLRNDHDRNYEDEAADMLERQQRRIAELEAQREGMVLVPMEPTEGIREVIRNEHGAYGSEDELYSALIAAATKED